MLATIYHRKLYVFKRLFPPFKSEKKIRGGKKKKSAFYILFFFFPPIFFPILHQAGLLANNSKRKGVNCPPSSFLHLNKVLTSRPSWDHLNSNIIKHSSLAKVRGRKEHFNPFRASHTTRKNLNLIHLLSPSLGTPVHTVNCTLVPSGI